MSQGISSDSPQGRITTLDGFRALAILSVLAFHYTVRWSPEHDPASHLAGGAVFAGFAPFEYGWLGVELFFIISGFVIWMTLERCATVGEFARRRIARITPALVCAAVLTSLVVILLGPKDWTPGLFDFASSIVPVDPRLFTPQGRWVDGAYWTLFVEARFYILAALAFWISRKNFAWLWLALQMFVFVGRFAFRQDYTFNLVFFPQYFSYFTLGIFVYEVYAKKRPSIPAVVAALLAASLVLLQARFGSQPYGGSTPWIVVSVNLAIFALFALFLFDHPVLKVFRLAPMIWLGEVSYSLYLLHQHIGISLMRQAAAFGIPYLAILPAVIGLMLALARLSFIYVERPAKRWVLGMARRESGTSWAWPTLRTRSKPNS